MKKKKSEITSYEELEKFFDNEIINEEISLHEDRMKKQTSSAILFHMLDYYITTTNVKSLSITWNERDGLHRYIAYDR